MGIAEISGDNLMCYECDANDLWCNDPTQVENRAKKVKCEADMQLCIESYAFVMGAEATSRKCSDSIGTVHCWDVEVDDKITRGCICNETLCNIKDYRTEKTSTTASSFTNSKTESICQTMIIFIAFLLNYIMLIDHRHL